MDKVSQEVEDQILSCHVCFLRYESEGDRTPKTLNCGHDFCKECLLYIVEKSVDKRTIMCPMCRAETTIALDGIDSLRSSLVVTNLLGIMTSYITGGMSVVSNNIQIAGASHRCGFCEDDAITVDVNYGCCDCKCYLCSTCKTVHGKRQALRSHTVLSLEEYDLRFSSTQQVNFL